MQLQTQTHALIQPTLTSIHEPTYQVPYHQWITNLTENQSRKGNKQERKETLNLAPYHSQMNFPQNHKYKIHNNKEKKTKRSQKNENVYRNFRVYYINSWGLKPKIDSLMEVLNEVSPTVLRLVETCLQEDDVINIQRYGVDSEYIEWTETRKEVELL